MGETNVYRPRPVPYVHIGQQWVDHGIELQPDTYEPKPCPLCGTITCGEDHATKETRAEDQQREEEFNRIDEERAQQRERERVGRDPESFFDPIRGW